MMIKEIKLITLLLFLLMCGNSFSQNKFRLDYNEIKGKLTQADKYKKDFGRYYGYEMPLYKGETANFILYSNEFNGKLILVDPNGKVYKQSSNPAKNVSSIITPIPISGDWILYVIGDQKDHGEFILRYAFAEQGSLNAPNNMDFCSTINFLITHADAHFMMLASSNSELPKLPASLNSDIDENSGSFINVIEKGNSKDGLGKRLTELSGQIKNCLPDWKENVITPGEKYSYTNPQGNENILIELTLSQNSDDNDFTLTLSMKRM